MPSSSSSTRRARPAWQPSLLQLPLPPRLLLLLKQPGSQRSSVKERLQLKL
jgi:hypothetical protein